MSGAQDAGINALNIEQIRPLPRAVPKLPVQPAPGSPDVVITSVQAVNQGIEHLNQIVNQLKKLRASSEFSGDKLANVELRGTHEAKHDLQGCVRLVNQWAKGASNNISETQIKTLAQILNQGPCYGLSYGKAFAGKDQRRSEYVATFCQLRLQDSWGRTPPAKNMVQCWPGPIWKVSCLELQISEIPQDPQGTLRIN